MRIGAVIESIDHRSRHLLQVEVEVEVEEEKKNKRDC